MKRAQTSPFSSPKCQLPEPAPGAEVELRTRPRRKPGAILDGSQGEESIHPKPVGEDSSIAATAAIGQEGSIRRTRTVPTKLGERFATAAEKAPCPERRQRRNLSRVSKDDVPIDELLVDTGKRVSCSSRNLKLHTAASERSLEAFSSKKTGGRAATPLDIPFYPTSSLARAVSAEPNFDAFLDDAIEANKLEIRRTRTQIAPSQSAKCLDPSSSAIGGVLTRSERSLRRDRSLKTPQQIKNGSDSSLSIEEVVQFDSKARDSARDLKRVGGGGGFERNLATSKKRISLTRLDTALPEGCDYSDPNKKANSSTKNEEVMEDTLEITIERPSKKVSLSYHILSYNLYLGNPTNGEKLKESHSLRT